MVKNKQLITLLGAFLFTSCIFLFPPDGFTQEKKTIDGMVQIERNHLYMISVGSDEGVSKGDPIEIFRVGVKVAEARLISVLPDSSMIEILGFYNVTEVYESDTVHYVSREAVTPTVLPTLSSSAKTGEIIVSSTSDSDIPPKLDDTGLLGSASSVGRSVYKAKAPLQKEIDSLKVGIQALEEDYDGKISTVLDTVKGGPSRAALNVEKKWKERLQVSEDKYKNQLSAQRKALEDEFANEKKRFEDQIEALKIQIGTAGEVGDKRTEQLMRDLESTDVKINQLRSSYERERTFDKEQWAEKVAALEENYQTQLRNQQNEFKRELLYSTGRFEDEIAYLKKQNDSMKENHARELELQVNQLRNEQSIVKSLRKDIEKLETDISEKNKQLVISKKEAIESNDTLKSEKSAHVEKIKAFKLPYERQIKELKEEVLTLKQSHKEELKSVELAFKEQLLVTQEEQEDQILATEGKYQFDISQLKKTSKDKAEFLQVQLNDRQAVINALEKDNAKLQSELRQNEKHIEQLTFNVKTLMSEHEDFKKKRDRDVELTNNSIKEDKSLIKFLNSEMAELTDDIEDKDKKIANLEDKLVKLEEDLSETKLSNQAKTHELTKDYEKKIKSSGEAATKKLLSSQEKWQSDLIAQEKDYIKKLDIQRDDYEKKMADLGRQIVALQGDSESVISKLNEQIEERDENTDVLEEKIAELVNQLEMKTEYGEELESNVGNLNDELAEVKTLHSKELSELGKQITALRSDSSDALADLQSQLGDKNSEIKLLNAEITGLSSGLQKKTEQADTLAERVEELTDFTANTKLSHAKEIAELNERIRELQGDSNSAISKLQNELAERNSMVKSLESKNDGLMAELQMKVDQAGNLEDNVAQLNENIVKLKESHAQEVAELDDHINTLRGDSDSVIANLQDQLKERQALVKSLEGQIDELKVNVDQRDVKLAKLNDDFTELKIKLDETKVTHSEKVKYLKRPLEARYKKAESELALAKKIHENQINELKSSAKNDLAIAEDRFDTKLALKNEEHQKILEIQKEDYEEKIDELGLQLAALKGDSKSTIGKVQEKLDEKRDKISSLEKEIATLRSDLRVKDEELLNSSDKVDKLARKVKELEGDSYGDMRKLQSELQAKETLISSLEENNTELSSELEMSKAQLSKFGDNIVSLNESLRENQLSHAQKMKLEKMTLEEKIRELTFDLEMVRKNHANQLEDLHERKLLEESVAYDKRVALAKESLEAEIKMLKSELAFARENHDDKNSFLAEKAANDLRVAQERHQAEMHANDAKWKMKLAALEEDYRQQLSSGTEILKQKLSTNRGELRETIETLNERLAMLKNSSDNQVKELEAELAAKQYNEKLRESEFQKRFTDSEERWAAKLAEVQQKNQELLAQQKKVTSQEFLNDKKELRSTVVDLTEQMRNLRETSNKRIAELEDQLERKDYKLSLVEDTSQQSTFDIEEKWRAKLVALEEKYQRELIHQRRDIEQQVWAGREKQQTKVSDLTGQLNTIQEQHNLDLALKEEEQQAEVALLKGNFEQEINRLKEMSSTEMKELADKVRYQQTLIDNLERQKSDLEFGLTQKERSLSHTESTKGNLKKEMRMLELSYAEKLRLSQESAKAKIDTLSAELAVARDRATQERIEMEDRWKEKFRKAEQDYFEKLKIQQQSLEQELDETNERLKLSKQSKEGEIDEVRDELEDTQSLVQLLTREKQDLTRELEGKSREVVGLNEEIIRLKENVDDYKAISEVSYSKAPSAMIPGESGNMQALAPKSSSWYTGTDSSSEYYSIVRKAILNNFQKFDFSKYAGKEGVVKIDFELFADGTTKVAPEFIGTQDEGLKGLLMQCFEGAAPFPPFPKELNKESQRFALSVSFKN